MSKKCSSPGCAAWAFEAGLCKAHFGALKPDKPAGVSHTPAHVTATATPAIPPSVAGGAAKSLAPHAPPALASPSPASLPPPGPNSVSARTQDVAKEDLKAKPPLTGSFDFLAPPRGDESMLEVCADFIEDAKAGRNAMRPKELCSACKMCDDHGRDMKLYQETQPGAVPSRLSRALVAVLGLYTAELAGVSPYGACNEALRSADRSKCKPFIRFIWFLMHAMAKCDRYEGTQVFRGVKADLSAEYPKDREVTWFQFSSCTCDIEVEKNEQFCGSTGTRTLFSIELTTGRARTITKFSLVPSEAEVLLPPNSRFKVLGQLNAGNGLVIIQLKELPSRDPILDFDMPVAPAPSSSAAATPPLFFAASGGAPALDPELDALADSLVSLKVGVSKACAEFAASLGKEGILSIADLADLTEADARDVLTRAGMSKIQQNKVLQAVAHASAPAPASAAAKAAAAVFIAGKPDIFEAARTGDISLVGHHVTAQPSCVNAKNERGSTALMWSAMKGHLEVCKLLISSKSDVNSSNQDGDTALINSAGEGHIEVCKLLVSSKCDVNSSSQDGNTALMFSAQNGHIEVCKLLVSSKCDVNSSSQDGRTALMFSAHNGHLEVCKLLISSKSDVNSSNQNGCTALMYSAIEGHLEVCKLLVSSKADLAARSSDGRTALKWAMACHKSEVVAFLLSIGAPQ